MKKLITALAIASLVTTPALARGRDHERRESHGSGGWVAPLLGGLIIGAIVAGSDRDDDRRYRDDRRYDRYEDPRYRPYDPYEEDRYSMPRRPQYYEHYCVTEQITDRRGTYFRKTCQ